MTPDLRMNPTPMAEDIAGLRGLGEVVAGRREVP